jgi:hypothetical protein
MAVHVTLAKETNTLEFRTEGSGDDTAIAEYLCKLVRTAKALGEKETLVAKSQLGDAVLEQRRLLADKVALLKDVAAKEDERSRRQDLAPEIRQLASAKALEAAEQARQITAELDGRQSG